MRRTAAAGISRPEIDGGNGDTEQVACLRGDGDLTGGASRQWLGEVGWAGPAAGLCLLLRGREGRERSWAAAQ